MPRGARVTHVSVKVVMRNPRTAFETAATNTTLATFNQNKFGCYAIGLNHVAQGMNATYTFGAGTEPMIPVKYDKPYPDAYNKQALVWYGQQLSTAGANEADFKATLPIAFFNLPSIMNTYWTNFCDPAKSDYKQTWQRFNKYITKFDASHYIGEQIIHYEYSPKKAYLNAPLLCHRQYAYAKDNTAVFTGWNEPSTGMGHVITVNGNKTSKSNAYMKLVTAEKKVFDTIEKRYLQPLDLSHMYHSMGDHDRDDAVAQPSLHVGVYPVPRLTTTSNSLVPESFTDVEATWDVYCEAHVEYEMHRNDFARFSDLNVSLGEQQWTADQTTPFKLETNYTTYNKRYPYQTTKVL